MAVGAGVAAEEASYELPPELLIDAALARRIIAEFVRGHLRQTGFERVIVNLSGGLDSALVAFLVAEAIGAERLLWGTDLTMDTGLAKLRALDAMGLPAEGLAAIRWKNAARIFRLSAAVFAAATQDLRPKT